MASERLVFGSDAERGAAGVLPLRQALPQLARLIALDTRVYVDVIKLEERPCVVQCFQFKTRVLLTVYDPELSHWDHCFVEIAHIDKLLEPNFTEIDNFVLKYPPNNIEELYQQLIKLLKYER
jgi:hypothetical protein